MTELFLGVMFLWIALIILYLVGWLSSHFFAKKVKSYDKYLTNVNASFIGGFIVLSASLLIPIFIDPNATFSTRTAVLASFIVLLSFLFALGAYINSKIE
ncbi:hypothetical protein ACFL1B_02835 [Nanoarchaeota archaeon]